MASGLVYTTLLQNAGYTPESWSQEIIREAQPNMVWASSVSEYAFPPGSKLHIPKISSVAANTVTRGSGADGSTKSALTYDTIADTDVEMTPTFAYSGYEISFAARNEVAARAPIWLEAMRWRSANAITQKIESAGLSLYSGVTTNTVDASGGLTWDLLSDAVQKLKMQDVNGPYVGIFHPNCYKELLAISEVNLTNAGGPDLGENSPVRSGENIRSLGIRIYFSTNVQESTNKKNLIFDRGAFGLARLTEVRMESETDLQYGVDRMLTYLDFAVATTDETRACLVETAGE